MEILFLWVVFIIVGGAIGHAKGRTGMGIGLSILLGIFGVLIIAVMPANQAELANRGEGPKRKCPYCAELIQREARVCPYCRKDV